MVHKGHRERMRRRVSLFGTDSLEAHELLEILLYSVIPYVDTNPTAHHLLTRFSEPRNVFSATREELLACSGIGDAAVDFLRLCGEVDRAAFQTNARKPVLREPFAYAERIYRECDGKSKVFLLLFNNRFEQIALETVHIGEITSASFHHEKALRTALLGGASFAVLAHTRNDGIAIPRQEELHSAATLREKFSASGVPLLDHLLIVGDHIVSLFDSKRRFPAERISSVSVETAGGSESRKSAKAEKSVLTELLSYTSVSSPSSVCDGLLSRLISLRNVLRASTASLRLTEGITPDAVVLFRVLGESLLRKTPRLSKNGKPLSLDDAAAYIRDIDKLAMYENVYLLLLDSDGCFLDCVKVGEGVTNSAVFLPRRLLEIALFESASAVILAHTHPDGNSQPSEADISATYDLRRVFADCGIRFVEHITVVDDSYEAVLSYSERNRLDGDYR